jgi:hypothetical protein
VLHRETSNWNHKINDYTFLDSLVQPLWDPGALGFGPGAALVAKSKTNTLFTQTEPQNLIICQEVRTSGPPARPQVAQGPQG